MKRYTYFIAYKIFFTHDGEKADTIGNTVIHEGPKITAFKAICKTQAQIKEFYETKYPHWDNINIIITNIQLLDEVDV